MHTAYTRDNWGGVAKIFRAHSLAQPTWFIPQFTTSSCVTVGVLPTFSGKWNLRVEF